MCRELPQVEEENILEEIVIVMVMEDHTETKDPLTEEDTQAGRPPDRGGYPHRGGRPPDRGGYPGGGPPDRGRGPPGGGYPNGGGRPPGRGGYPDPLIEEDPLMEEDLLEDKDHQALKDLLGP